MGYEWKTLGDEHHAYAVTQFVKMRVGVDMPRTRSMDAIRYDAQISDLSGNVLCDVYDLSSMVAACSWCDAQYTELLRAELKCVGGVTIE